MSVWIPEEYRGREQTYFKHCVLRDYLRAWVQKLGSMSRRGPLTIYYVDCFAGPWRSAEQEHRDTSVAIGLEALSEAISVWRDEHGAYLSAHAIFVEANPTSAAQLRAYVAQHTPPGITAQILEGTFESHAARISSIIGQSPAFIFVDPTGWKGVGMDSVALVARGPRRDVMVNVMYEHINRFKDDERAFLREQMRNFFGVDLDSGLTEVQLMQCYRSELSARSGLQYAADLAIPEPRRRRTYFRLVLATGHPAALELFRKVEHDVCGRDVASVREGIRRQSVEDLGQTELELELGGPGIDIDFARAREEALQMCRAAVREAVQQAGQLTFKNLWPAVLERHHVTIADVRAAVVELDGKDLTWRRSKGAKQTKVRNEDVISAVSAKRP